MESIRLNQATREHMNEISTGYDQVIEDVIHRLTLRKGDYIFDVSQGVDYEIVFGKMHDIESKVEHLKSVMLENKQVKEVTILAYRQEGRVLNMTFSLLLENHEVIEGGVTLGA